MPANDNERWYPADTVPRKMLELCKHTLRVALARNLELRDQVDVLEHEVRRLEDLLRRCRDRH